MFIPVAEFRPDVADLNTNFSDEIRNVLPADGSYIPMPSFSKLSAALPAKPLGGIAVRGVDGTVAIFVGTATRLYRLDQTNFNWVDVSQTGTNYNANEEARWSFAAFGAYIIAVNKNDAPQRLQLGVDSQFHNLGGNPPRAGLVKIWGDFVCLMQLPDHPRRVHWSGLNDAEWWTVGTRNCDFQDFADGGVVQGSTQTTSPLIFLQSSIYMASFVPGSDIVFSFQKLHEKRGSRDPLSIATRGSVAFFADEGGFFQIASDGSLKSIGFEKVDRTIFAHRTQGKHAMMAVIDPIAPRVYWAIDNQGEGNFSEVLIYDWGLERWSIVSVDLCDLLPIYNTGVTLDGLDALFSNLDNVPFSLDSRVWGVGAPILGAFARDFRLGAFSGQAMAATISTAEMGAVDGLYQWLHGVYPIVDSEAGQVFIGMRSHRHASTPMKWRGPYAASMATGRYLMRVRGRFHKVRFQLKQGAQWRHIRGFDVEMKAAGWR